MQITCTVYCLKKFREDFLDKRLLEYRKNGINYFMDQDALNVCFEEKVIYLPLYFNVMSSVIGFFTGEDIQKYYELDTSDKSVIYERAVIVHLCTRICGSGLIKQRFNRKMNYTYPCRIRSKRNNYLRNRTAADIYLLFIISAISKVKVVKCLERYGLALPQEILLYNEGISAKYCDHGRR